MSILAKLNAAKDKAALPKPRADHDPLSLRGTGITKKLAASDTAKFERDAAKAMQTDMGTNEARSDFNTAMQETMAAIEESAKRKDIVLDESQVEAVAGILHNRYAILTGEAGTGKTTVTGIALEELEARLSRIDFRSTQYERVEVMPGHFERIRGDEMGAAEERDYAPSIAIATFTGRAAQQCKRALDERWHRHVSTMHSLLGYAPTEETIEENDPLYGGTRERTRKVFRPTFDATNKLPFDAYFIDEAPMVPIPLWNEFIEAIKPNARIYLIGDINQLPPVMGKSMVGYAMQKWPIFHLRHIHRQAQGNAIIMNAHKILNGQMPVSASNVHLIGGASCPSGSSGMQNYIVAGVQMLWKSGKYNPLRDVIIVPQNVSLFGTEELNKMFVTMFNEERTENGIVVNKRIRINTGTGDVTYAVGDKVMMTANINNVSPVITNGMMGIVESISINGKHDMKRSKIDYAQESVLAQTLDQSELIDIDEAAFNLESLSGMMDAAEDKEETLDQRQASHILQIRFETGQTYLATTAGDFRKVSLGYVITCHKAQGGEYPNVVIVVHSAHQRSLSREWLYTAFTRARNNVFLVYNVRGLGMSVSRQMIKGKTLAEKIASFIMQTVVPGLDGTSLEHVDRKRFPVLFNPVGID